MLGQNDNERESKINALRHPNEFDQYKHIDTIHSSES